MGRIMQVTLLNFDSSPSMRKLILACCALLVPALALQLARGQSTPAAAQPAAQSQLPQPQQPAPRPAAPQTAGQQPGAQPPAQDIEAPTIKVQANEVDLVFTVTDKKGHFVTGLNQSSFGLLDDGRSPEAVLHFYQQTNLPLRVGIMLDTSSSIRGRFEFEQDSAIAFLLQVMHQNDRAFVEGFDVEVDLATSISSTRGSASFVRAAARRCTTRCTPPARTRC